MLGRIVAFLSVIVLGVKVIRGAAVMVSLTNVVVSRIT